MPASTPGSGAAGLPGGADLKDVISEIGGLGSAAVLPDRSERPGDARFNGGAELGDADVAVPSAAVSADSSSSLLSLLPTAILRVDERLVVTCCANDAFTACTTSLAAVTFSAVAFVMATAVFFWNACCVESLAASTSAATIASPSGFSAAILPEGLGSRAGGSLARATPVPSVRCPFAAKYSPSSSDSLSTTTAPRDSTTRKPSVSSSSSPLLVLAVSAEAVAAARPPAAEAARCVASVWAGSIAQSLLPSRFGSGGAGRFSIGLWLLPALSKARVLAAISLRPSAVSAVSFSGTDVSGASASATSTAFPRRAPPPPASEPSVEENGAASDGEPVLGVIGEKPCGDGWSA